ncbi:hypothetical protein GX51_02938 [Blastomyces parvus]|uniref:PLD phosphodiesterase domain-containing protein n=1 Tax=Blastomyces parvus TaxID=2060905 RepID=A0A2B7X1C4_9EURO|nr:hypothetical protein GX51_02938 [Blastomyces parvus]
MANLPYSVEKWRQHVATDPLEGHDLPSLNDSATAVSMAPSFCTGTGLDILTNYICPDIETADREVIFVTCFWATMSESRVRLCKALRTLSKEVVKKRAAASNATTVENVKIYICLSSVSLLQKLRHTESTAGYVYDSTEWNQKLKLPPPEEIPGVDLTVKSIFIRPFSVMHPKFVIVDRKFVWVPSCNVSWESWYEGAFRLKGRSIVEKFHKFWTEVWNPEAELPHWAASGGISTFPATTSVHLPPLTDPPAKSAVRLVKSFPDTPANRELQTLFLPSSHHQDLAFRPGISRLPRPAPRTPLNAFTKFLFANAESEIYMITPNLTAKPVMHALVQALERGVKVTTVTNTNLMVMEQLGTAGTTTARCLKSLMNSHKRVLWAWARAMKEIDTTDAKKPGKLTVREWKVANPRRGNLGGESAFVKSHLKLTVVDETVVLFGSGNMDRASWYTSQEVGVALYSAEVVKEILHEVLMRDVEKHSRTIYESHEV